MPVSCGRDSSHPAESRSVTSADVDWLTLPASQEIPHSYAQSFHQAPDPTARPQLRRTPQVAAAVRTGELLQFDGAEKLPRSIQVFGLLRIYICQMHSTFDEEVESSEILEKGTKVSHFS